MKTYYAAVLYLIAAAAIAGETAPSQPLPPGHPSIGRAAEIGDVRVAKATGADARTVEEVIKQRAALKDKPVVVHGKVVKFNGGIMGKNWVHLRDGTGSAADGSNDVLVTTQDVAKVGDVVTVRGMVRTEKDFGSGYSYAVLIEDATVKP
jgi:hypothetical protein